MTILRAHVPWWTEILDLEGFLQDPILLFGYQDILIDPVYFDRRTSGRHGERVRSLRRKMADRRDVWLRRAHPDLDVPRIFQAPTLPELLRRKGCRDPHVVDLFDPRADLRYDMNHPVPSNEHGRYGTLIDVGSIEHLFDTRQVMENCLRMVRVGGHYLLHTPVKGYYRHGFHTFNPEGLLVAMTENGFEVVYHRYSTDRGRPLADPAEGEDVLIWLVGKKVAEIDSFTLPQEGRWEQIYSPGDRSDDSASPRTRRKQRPPLRLVPVRTAYRLLSRSPAAPLMRHARVQALRSRLLDLPPPGDRDVVVEGFRLRIPERFYSHYRNGYEVLATLWVRERLRHGMTVADVGAHLGYVSLLMSRSADKVYAVEPAPDNLAYLRENLRRNGARNVEVVPCAAGAERHTRTLRLTASSDSHGYYHPLTDTVETVEVEEVPLDELIVHVDLVKIDVEGAELDVLAGMRRLLDQRPRPLLLVEWAPACQERAGRGDRELVDTLRDMGYRLRVLDNHVRRQRSVDEVLGMLERGELIKEWHANVVCEPVDEPIR